MRAAQDSTVSSVPTSQLRFLISRNPQAGCSVGLPRQEPLSNSAIGHFRIGSPVCFQCGLPRGRSLAAVCSPDPGTRVLPWGLHGTDDGLCVLTFRFLVTTPQPHSRVSRSVSSTTSLSREICPTSQIGTSAIGHQKCLPKAYGPTPKQPFKCGWPATSNSRGDIALLEACFVNGASDERLYGIG
ncbi:hypothetical protein LZ31DRAFT_128491 [Colletotrichum somersetense]|nr:hypothetical protein LZ31DRAFT_128491 [Colletotrichum somersetense]